jgi:starch-binding outer membrane protein, SusD/RagB family
MSLFRTLIRSPRLGAVLLVPAALMIGCTDLKETPTSSLTKDTFYKNADEVQAGLVSVYSSIRSYFDDMYEMNQISSDEGVIPVRGSDWFDNGEHLEVHRQGWNANSVVGQREVNGIWNSQYAGIARANIVLEALDNVTIPNQAAIKSELRALRALFYFNLMDFYGGVPIATDTKVVDRAAKTRAEVFTFVETELKAARADLPKTWAGQSGRITQGAVDAILASMYINAQIFTGTVSATGIAPGAAKWTEAAAAADAVINSGTYTLAADYKANFSPTNQSSTENIFVMRNKAVDGLGYFRQYGALHYNSFPGGGGWNGFSIVAETYNKFDPVDLRRTVILAGPQFDLFPPNAPVKDRTGSPLVFTVAIADITSANEGEGVRLYKFPLDPAKAAQFSGNDYPVYRLAEMYLIKAEALNELGRTAEAIPLINLVRARAFSPAKPLAGLTQAQLRAAIFDERIFELIGEGKRRQDQIRQGTYTSGTWFGKTVTNTPYKVILPIPQSQLETNPLLKQNPGY